jgi:lysophospholipase L1-like esterase
MTEVASGLQNGQTILFIGDSITDCDRTVAQHAPLGWGYVRLFSDLLKVREPQKRIRVVNKGINGNTIAHLLSRWCDDVIEYRPDLLCILIGINDATRYLDGSSSLHRAPREFGETYLRLVEETRQRLPACRIALMEPFFISRGDDIAGSYRSQLIGNLQEYVTQTRKTAAAHDLQVIGLSGLFAGLLRHANSANYSEDKIHPNLTGHLAIAETVYHALNQE